MKRFPRFLLLGIGLILLGSLGLAQPGAPSATDGFVERLMAFDKNKDGKLSREEVTDTRLQRIFTRADTNKDNVVTKEELVALATQEAAVGGGGRGGFQFPKDKGGFPKDGFGKDKGFPGFPKDGFGKDGFGKGGFGFGRPTPGQLLSPFLQKQLNLTEEQKTQLDKLQKDVDGKLEKLLTEEQRETLKKMKTNPFGRDRGGKGGPEGKGPGGKGPGSKGDRP